MKFWARITAGGLLWVMWSADAQAQKVIPQQATRQDRPRPMVIHAHELNGKYVVFGSLGVPLQEVMTIAARARIDNGKGDMHILEVYEVNGQRLPRSVRVPYAMWPWANIKELEADRDYRLRVFETGGFYGVPDPAMRETVAVQSHGPSFQTMLKVINEVREVPTAPRQ